MLVANFYSIYIHTQYHPILFYIITSCMCTLVLYMSNKHCEYIYVQDQSFSAGWLAFLPILENTKKGNAHRVPVSVVLPPTQHSPYLAAISWYWYTPTLKVSFSPGLQIFPNLKSTVL
jgi:hypothetical protein